MIRAKVVQKNIIIRELMHKLEFFLFYKKENELFEMYNYIRVIITAISILLHGREFWRKIFHRQVWSGIHQV